MDYKNINQEDNMSREEKIEYINETLREADDDTLDEIFWALGLEG